MNVTAPAITKDLIVQHNLTDDEYEKIVETFWGRRLEGATYETD